MNGAGMLSSRHASVALALLSALFLAAWFYTGQSVHTGIWPLAASALLATILLSLSYIDLRTLLLPDLLTLPLLALGLAWSAWQGVGWIQAFLGAVLGYGIVAGWTFFGANSAARKESVWAMRNCSRRAVPGWVSINCRWFCWSHPVPGWQRF